MRGEYIINDFDNFWQKVSNPFVLLKQLVYQFSIRKQFFSTNNKREGLLVVYRRDCRM